MELNITFAVIGLNRQTGTMVMRQMALVARMKLPSNMANISLAVIFLQQVLRHPDEGTLKFDI